MAEGKQQVKLVIIEERDLNVVTERTRFTHSRHLLPLKCGTSISCKPQWKLSLVPPTKRLHDPPYEKKAQRLFT